jgi:hypothetical protein
MQNKQLQKSNLSALLSRLIEQDKVVLLLALPFTDLADEVDSTLQSLVHKNITSLATKYYAVLYSYRLSRSNLRGAAQAAFERLRRLKADNRAEPGNPKVLNAYLILINALACVNPAEAWVVVEPGLNDAFNKAALTTQLGKGRDAVKRTKRGVLTLEDVRREYQAELDRAADAERGRFPFVETVQPEEGDEDAMDVL